MPPESPHQSLRGHFVRLFQHNPRIFAAGLVEHEAAADALDGFRADLLAEFFKGFLGRETAAVCG